jgi:hypothetical protein
MSYAPSGSNRKYGGISRNTAVAFNISNTHHNEFPYTAVSNT